MDFNAARQTMVDSQVLPNRVTDKRVIEALAEVPREAFVPAKMQEIAYVDEAIAVAEGRYILEPMILARLMQAADLKSGDVALAIGSENGYAPAILARIVSTVVAVESHKGLAQQATRTLSDLGIDNVAVVEGALKEGYPKQGPYDVIFFNGAVDEFPDSIVSQVGDGGRLVAIVSSVGGTIGRAVLVINVNGVVSRRELFDAGTPMLPGFEREQTFAF